MNPCMLYEMFPCKKKKKKDKNKNKKTVWYDMLELPYF